MKTNKINEMLEKYKTSTITGLTDNEANERLKKYGFNKIENKEINPILKFLLYFWGPIPGMIEIAAILSAIIHDWAEFSIILTLLIINGVVEFWQEHKASNVIKALKEKMATKAEVLRNGKWKTIQTKYLVPGDIVKIKIGDIAPADIIILDEDYISVDESALTGESLPVNKQIGDEIYSGSIIKRGEITGVVKDTGLKTYFGKTVKMVENAKTVSSFQKMITTIGNYLIILAIILITIIFIVSIFRHENLIQTLRFALVLAVASIPAAMPAVLSITMAIGALDLARKQAVVTKLNSIEDLAGVDMLCSDKTGTLTKNQLVCGDIIPFKNFKKEDVILYGTLASKYNEDNMDAIDKAITHQAKKMRIFDSIKAYTISNFIPFDPITKRTEAEIKTKETKFKISKGAPQVITKLCHLDKESEKRISEKIIELAQKGYRALGVAINKNNKWNFVGIIPLYDPPRDDAPNAISKIKKLGVSIKMVTGDHRVIAKNIAKMLGLGSNIISITEFLKNNKNKDITKDPEMLKTAYNADGFSEVFPEHKYKIVDILQRKGHFVSMTGDGVNDAPALKKANCGIAVAGATDAARAAANIVLLSPGISVIADAIAEARRIFQRMESYAIYRIAETIRILLFMTLSILIFNFYPINAIMIVLLAILNDIPIIMIAYDNVIEPKKPVRWDMKKRLILSSVLGIMGLISSFLIYYIAEKVFPGQISFIQTFIFLKLIIAGHTTLFITRTKDRLWTKPFPNPKLFWSIIITDIIATFISVYGIFMKPIGWKWAIFIWIYAIIWMFINDTVKKITIEKLKMN